MEFSAFMWFENPNIFHTLASVAPQEAIIETLPYALEIADCYLSRPFVKFGVRGYGEKAPFAPDEAFIEGLK